MSSSPRSIDIFSPARRDLLRDWLVSRTGTRPDIAIAQINGFASGADDLELIQNLIRHKLTTTLSEVYLSRVLRGVRKLADKDEDNRAALCRAGALMVVAQGLRQSMVRQGKDQMLAAQTIGAIWSLSLSPAARERFINPAVLATLLSLIRSCMIQPYIIYQSLGSLRTLATHCKICELLLQQGTWELVLDCMEAHPSERDVQYLGLAALWTFVLSNGLPSLASPPSTSTRTLSLVPWCMTCFPDDRDIQHQGCGLLNALAFNSPLNREVLVGQQAACAVVAQALHSFPQDLEVTKQASGGVWILASNYAPAKSAFHACNVCPVLAQALDTFAEADGEVVCQICGALTTLLKDASPEAIKLIGGGPLSSAWRGAVKCSAVGRWNAEVARLASMVLVQISSVEGEIDQSIALEHAGAILQGLQSWNRLLGTDEIDIVNNLLEVTRRLLSSGGVVRRAIINLQGIPVVMQALVTRNDSRVLYKGLEALYTLLAGDQQGLGLAQVTADLGDAWSAYHAIFLKALSVNQPVSEVVVYTLRCMEALCVVGGMRARLLEGKGQAVVQILLDNLRGCIYADEDATIAALQVLARIASGNDMVKDLIRAKAVQFAFLTLQRNADKPGFVARALEILAQLVSSGASHDSLIKAQLVEKALMLHGDKERDVALHCASVVLTLSSRSDISRANFLGGSTLSLLGQLFQRYHSDAEVAESILLAATALSPGWDQYHDHQVLVLEPSAPESPAHSTITDSSNHGDALSFSLTSAPTLPPPITVDGPQRPPIKSAPIGIAVPVVRRQPSLSSAVQSPAQLSNPFTPPNNNIFMFDAEEKIAATPIARQWGDLDDYFGQLEAKSPSTPPPPPGFPVSQPLAPLPRKQSLDEHKLCVVCLEEVATHALLPCGHRCVCATHGEQLASGGKECPMCRRQITSAVHIFVM